MAGDRRRLRVQETLAENAREEGAEDGGCGWCGRENRTAREGKGAKGVVRDRSLHLLLLPSAAEARNQHTLNTHCLHVLLCVLGAQPLSVLNSYAYMVRSH